MNEYIGKAKISVIASVFIISKSFIGIVLITFACHIAAYLNNINFIRFIHHGPYVTDKYSAFESQ